MASEAARSLVERIRSTMPDLTPSERRVARALLLRPGLPELETAASLAETTGTSVPTVLRFVTKLRLDGYPAFRAAMLQEASARQDSPLAQLGRVGRSSPASLRERAGARFADAVATTFAALDETALDAALDLMADPRRHLLFAGGRFSQCLAELLFDHVNLIRPGCDLVRFANQSRFDRLVDLGRSHVLVMFDVRRYQADSVQFAREARRRRVRLILITDPWLSPIADWADVVLTADVRAPSPFDTLVPALAVAETLLAGLAERLGEEATSRRLQALEKVSGGFAWREGMLVSGGAADGR